VVGGSCNNTTGLHIFPGCFILPWGVYSGKEEIFPVFYPNPVRIFDGGFKGVPGFFSSEASVLVVQQRFFRANCRPSE